MFSSVGWTVAVGVVMALVRAGADWILCRGRAWDIGTGLMVVVVDCLELAEEEGRVSALGLPVIIVQLNPGAT